MTTLYLCGAGNSLGVRLALAINRQQARWDRIVLLDDDVAKQGQSILEVEIIGPFETLALADPDSTEVANLVARTTEKRQAARRKIEVYGLPFATLVYPGVDVFGAQLGKDVIVYQNATIGPGVALEEACVVFMGAVIGSDCRLGRCCIVASNAVLNAGVELGAQVYVGTNATVLTEIRIGSSATVGAGSVVLQDVPSGVSVMGVPAQTLLAPTEQSHPTPHRVPGRQTTGSSTAIPELERRLQELWREILGVPYLSRDDSFFDLGGDSLQSVRLFSKIKELFGLELAPETLIMAPTIRQLAGLLEQPEESAAFRSVVDLRQGGTKPALFLVHDVLGGTLGYRNLVSCLESDRPVRGFRPHPGDALVAPSRLFSHMVDYYVEEMQVVQPQGPYLLSGLCFGGNLAFEIACRLQARGESVPLVALLESVDVEAPATGLAKTRWQSFWAGLQTSASYTLTTRLTRALRYAVGKVKNLTVHEARSRFDRYRVALRDLYVRRGVSLPRFLKSVPRQALYAFAESHYHPERQYQGRLILFRAAGGESGQASGEDVPMKEKTVDPLLGWETRATRGVAVFDVPGGHASMLHQPHVGVLADELSALLQNAEVEM